MNKQVLEELILNINTRTKIRNEIIEKDYYVCMILKELSIIQSQLKAYFKGGTAIYKILNHMNRFSEDIDLTVKVIEKESNNSNKTRLKKSALGYSVNGLELIKEETIDNKGSVTAFYKYNSLFNTNKLFKSGRVQIEATSFTVSEPVTKYKIEPIIYRYATKEEKEILKSEYDISPFEIETIKLERIFVDKIFATEFYYVRKMYDDVSKHLYDISVLMQTNIIKKLLNDKSELVTLIKYKRKEEKIRLGGVAENKKISDFEYMTLNFNKDLITSFERMQRIYVLDDESKLSINQIKKSIQKLHTIIKAIGY